jgi:hypothetical protein
MFRYYFFGSLLTLTTSIGLAQSINVNPIGDVWFYKNAPNPATDPYALAWGDGTNDLAPTFPPDDFYSYSYFKFDLGGAFDSSKTYTLTMATLTVYQYPGAGFDADLAKNNPLLARALGDGWEESTYAFGAGNPSPGSLLGAGDMSNYDKAGYWAITIDLLSGDVGAITNLFNDAVHSNGHIDFSLSTIMNPGGQTGTKYYTLATREAQAQYRPTLEITTVPEPGAMVLFGLLGLLARRKGHKSTQNGVHAD